MIELTQEQVQSVGQPDAMPPRVLNPQTREMFVLLPLAEYERLVHDDALANGSWDDVRAELAGPISDERRDALLQLIGIWKTDQPPSDEDVMRILEEERMKKHG